MNILMLAMYEALKSEVEFCNKRTKNFRCVLQPSYTSLCLFIYEESETKGADLASLEIYLKEDFTIQEVIRSHDFDESDFFDEKGRLEVNRVTNLFDKFVNDYCID